MDYLFLTIVSCLLVVDGAHLPEVYESNAQKQPPEKFEKPPAFNYQDYQKGTQFDPQRIRYQQQQQVDTSNNSRPRQIKETEVITAPSRTILDDLERETPPIPKGKITKKSLKPNSYTISDDLTPPPPPPSASRDKGTKRQDETAYINYVEGRNPKVLQQNLASYAQPTNGDHLHALNSLLGQTPENQLHGLQQLLNGNYKPIKEDVLDFPNPQRQPNIHVHANGNQQVVNQALHSLSQSGSSPDALKSLQAQLDATASAHAENIIAQAQQKALEHVKAQHEAIARAQQAAEQTALKQIEAQNAAHAEQAAKEHKEREEKRKQQERRRQSELARERARIAALAYKRKQEQEQLAKEKENRSKDGKDDRALQDDPHHVAQTTRAKNSALKLKKVVPEIAETQNHYFAAPTEITRDRHYVHHAQPLIAHTTAQTYYQQPAISNAQAQSAQQYEHTQKYNERDDDAEVSKYYIPPQFTVIGQTKNAHGEPELHYAANYEFGYRIRDYHHGNDYGHKETKDGETTKGEYHALLPDGRMQTVTYYVDDSGYHAEVSYGGGAHANH